MKYFPYYFVTYIVIWIFQCIVFADSLSCSGSFVLVVCSFLLWTHLQEDLVSLGGLHVLGHGEGIMSSSFDSAGILQISPCLGQIIIFLNWISHTFWVVQICATHPCLAQAWGSNFSQTTLFPSSVPDRWQASLLNPHQWVEFSGSCYMDK